jgi:cold shock CspA family protein
MTADLITGTLREWDATRSFGFLEPDLESATFSRSVFVHRNAFGQSQLAAPQVGQRYRFRLRLGPAGKVQAFDLVQQNSDAPAKDGVALGAGGVVSAAGTTYAEEE